MFVQDCTSGPCPECGATGDVPNAMWTLVPRALSLVQETRPSAGDLAAFGGLLTEHLRSTIDLDVLAAKVQQDAPSAAPLLSILRDPATQTVLALLALLVAIATLVLQIGGDGPEEQSVQQPQEQQDRGDVGKGVTDVQADNECDPDCGQQ